MSNTYTGLAAGGLRIQKYSNFRGVDFTDSSVSEYRSPDALNMWKNYKTLGKRIETRPEIELQLKFSNTIYGLFFYTINKVDHWIIHCGTSLNDYNPKTKETKTIKTNGMNPFKSTFFIYNNILFIKDGINYLEYDGSTLKDVVGTIPLTTIARKPSGGGTQYQDINLISDYRKNGFWGDGESTEYHLDATEVSDVTVWIDDVEQDTSSYSVDGTNGIITFNEAPEKTDNKDNVVIQYKKVVSGYSNRIKKCTLACLFDNRVFFSGNQDYPNMLYWCSYNDPRYISDMNYSIEGTDSALVKALVPGNNALWVFKEPSQANTTVFYHVPTETMDSRLNDTIKVYPSSHSSISTGCTATGINFHDDICFFSDRGMEGISGDITTEQILGHRSTLIDRKLLNEKMYQELVLVEWEGYLLVIIDNNIYLADSKMKVTNNDHVEYEWFYWEVSKKIKSAIEHKGDLFLCSKEENETDENGYKKYTDGTDIFWHDEVNNVLYDESYEDVEKDVSLLTAVMVSGIYTLTDNSEDRNVKSYWITPQDDYGYTQMLKTTNKKGFKTDIEGTPVKIYSKVDNSDFDFLGEYQNTKGYIVAKLKRKKWNKIQLKFESDKPIGLYSIALEAYIGSYVKRS